MEYAKFDNTYYVRLDRGEEIVASILDLCGREGVRSATFSGIGGCSDAEIQVFDPVRGEFDTERYECLLELVSITGNVFDKGDGNLAHHAHALFACQGDDGQQHVAAGHLKSTTVLYTAELELRPVTGGTIGARLDDETGTYFWKLS